MNEDVVYSAARIVGFTPLELVLLSTIAIIAIALWRFVLKESKESTQAINNNSAILKELKDEFARKLRKATKL